MRRMSRLYEMINEKELYHGQEELLEAAGDGLDEDMTKRILQRTLKAVQEEKERINHVAPGKKKSRRIGKRKLGILVIAAVLLGALTVSAAEYFGIRAELVDFLGISGDVEKEKLESMVTDIEKNGEDSTENKNSAAAEKDGVRIAASQMFSDGETVYVYFDVELPEGIYPEDASEWNFGGSTEENSRYVRFHRMECLQNGEETGINGMVIQKNEKEHYYAIGLMSLKDTGTSKEPQKVKLELKDFGYIDSSAEKTEWVTLVPGIWTLEWTLDCQNVSLTYSLEKTFKTASGNFTLESVRLSPLSIKLVAASETLDAIVEDGQAMIAIEGFLMKDGSFEQLLTWSYTGPEDGKLVLGGNFDHMVEPEEIVGVRILGEDVWFGE